MDIIEVLSKNKKFLKIASIEKEIGLKQTELTRMIARGEILQKHKDKIEKWWNNFIRSLEISTWKISKEPSIFNNIPVIQNGEQIGFVKYRIAKKESVPNEPILDSKKEDEIVHKNSPKERYDFGDDKFFVIEKYTKYPLKDMPKNTVEKFNWMKEKAEADHKIKLAWNNRNKNGE